MESLDFSRSLYKPLETFEDRLFNAIKDYGRSDGVSVDFSGKTIKTEIYDKHGGTLLDTLTSGTEITISTERLIYSKIFTDLEVRAYYYQTYNDTDKVGISHGPFIVN